MKIYELYLVLRPDLNEAEVEKTISEVGGLWSKNGFGVSASSTKPRERLPYPIKHFTEAHAVDLEFSGPDEAARPEEIETALNHNENILRHMIMAKSERLLKKMKPFAAFESRVGRAERRAAVPAETPLGRAETKTETGEINVEEVDKKLEELLK